MRKIIAALAFSLLVLTFLPGVASTQTLEPTVSRTVSNANPSPGEIVTVYIKPSYLCGLIARCFKPYAVEEYIYDLQYTGENTADSNPEGTIFVNIAAKDFEYKVKVPQDAYPGERFVISGEFWTDPDNSQPISPKRTTLTVAGPTDVPIVFIAPHYQSVDPGQPFTLNIEIRPQGKGVSAVGVTMRFDAGAMSVDKVEMGNLLGAEAVPAPGYPQIDNAGGTVQIAAARKGATPLPTAEGVFARIWFTAGNEFAAQGTHLFTLEKVQLVDENSLDISGIIKGSGSVTMKTPSEILPDGGGKYLEPEERVSPDGGETPGNVECPRWDINENGLVEWWGDGMLLGEGYEQTSAQWPTARCDINEDGFVELKDHSLLCAHLDQELDCGNTESSEPSESGGSGGPTGPGSGASWPDWNTPRPPPPPGPGPGLEPPA